MLERARVLNESAESVSTEDPQPPIPKMHPALTLGRKWAALSILAVSLTALPAQAQDIIGNGFANTASQPNPVAFSSYDTLPSGERVVFDGLSIDLYDGAGGFMMNLASLPAFVFNSFVVADPTNTFAIAGESSNGDIIRVALDGSGWSTIGNLNFNYDAAFEGPNSLLISAATCGFGCGNDIVRMDATTGATTFLANVVGASGPVAVADNGDLFYGTADFSAPNSTQILRWSVAQLNSGLLLSEADAAVIASGLAGAASIDVDPVFGNVFLAESIFGATSRILEFDPNGAGLVDVVVESSSYLGSVELMQDSGIGHFHAYQPQDGVFLHYSNGDIETVRAQRPTATHVQRGPVATFQVQNAEPNSGVLVLFSSNANYDPNYITYLLNGMDFQFHSSVPVFLQRRTPLLIPTDANGTATFQYYDPGSLAGTLVFQALVTNASGTFIGSSEAVLN